MESHRQKFEIILGSIILDNAALPPLFHWYLLILVVHLWDLSSSSLAKDDILVMIILLCNVIVPSVLLMMMDYRIWKEC